MEGDAKKHVTSVARKLWFTAAVLGAVAVAACGISLASLAFEGSNDHPVTTLGGACLLSVVGMAVIWGVYRWGLWLFRPDNN